MAMIQRWGSIDRLTHWLLLIGVTIEIVSGLPLFSHDWFGFLTFFWQNKLLGYPLHIFAAFALMSAVAIHIGYRAISKKKHSEMWFTKKDLGVSDHHRQTLVWDNQSVSRIGFPSPRRETRLLVRCSFGAPVFRTQRTAYVVWSDIRVVHIGSGCPRPRIRADDCFGRGTLPILGHTR